jgi:hypothetical protein
VDRFCRALSATGSIGVGDKPLIPKPHTSCRTGGRRGYNSGLRSTSRSFRAAQHNGVHTYSFKHLPRCHPVLTKSHRRDRILSRSTIPKPDGCSSKTSIHDGCGAGRRENSSGRSHDFVPKPVPIDQSIPRRLFDTNATWISGSTVSSRRVHQDLI